MLFTLSLTYDMVLYQIRISFSLNASETKQKRDREYNIFLVHAPYFCFPYLSFRCSLFHMLCLPRALLGFYFYQNRIQIPRVLSRDG